MAYLSGNLSIKAQCLSGILEILYFYFQRDADLEAFEMRFEEIMEDIVDVLNNPAHDEKSLMYKLCANFLEFVSAYTNMKNAMMQLH